MQSFGEAIQYAHSLDKKVYATVNGFPFNSQIPLVEKHLHELAEIKPDALIISTPGVIKLAKKIMPDIDLHLSTQANVLNYLDAEVFSDMGVTRIIAAREVSLKDLCEIKERLPHLEIEMFVHGSMCFAYSGRCLISALQMGRVPNRGSCANDCRMPYSVYVENPEHKTLMRVEEVPDEGTYIFNAKDLNMSAHIKDLLDSGAIDSLKIEGRTKSLYYAAFSTMTYRTAIDDYYTDKFEAKKYQNELEKLKNRGYTDAYVVHRPFEKDDTQNHETAMSEGEAQVAAFVTEDEQFFLCKDKVLVGVPLEILSYDVSNIEPVENEIGRIYSEDGIWKIVFNKIVCESEKELSSVHSGNTNKIKLPAKLPKYSFFMR
jgi:putative protease